MTNATQATPAARYPHMSPLEHHIRGLQCPECGATDIDDNGCDEPERITFLCVACGLQWEPTSVADDAGDEGWDTFERVYGVTVLEDRIVHMSRREYEGRGR